MTRKAFPTELSFRQGSFSDPDTWGALADLLRDIFDIDVSILDDLGGPDPAAMSFSWFDGAGRCAGNLTALPMPLMMQGQVVPAYGLQSGAVRPEWRGRGLYRDLLGRALAWCEGQGSELVLLATHDPVLYQRFGFRPVAEHGFTADPPAPEAVGPQARRLHVTRWADLALLQELLARRTPVSDVVSVTHHATMFLFNAASAPDLQLSYLPSIDAVVAWEEEEDGTFRLVDIVSPAIPSLAFILAALDLQPATIEICFPPDKLAIEADARPLRQDHVLMVRGEIPQAMRHPFRLPATTSF